MLLKRDSSKISKILVSFLSFLIPAFAIVYIQTSDISVWLSLIPGLLLTVYFFGFYGSSIYIFFSCVLGAIYFYKFILPCNAYDYIDLIHFLYSFLMFIAIMLAINVVFSLKVLQVKKANQSIASLMYIDQLTGLHNYGYFIERLKEERERADREDCDLSLIMLDLDYFKSFNDRFGHQRGNELLEKVGKIIQQNIRSGDIVCRYGGEEFAVILPGTSTKKAFEVAERIRKAVESETFFGNRAYPRIRKTISAGVATYPEHAKDEYELIDVADRALYFAKDKGRNRTVVYSEEVEREWFFGAAEKI